MECSPPSSSVHGISQVWILEWVAISFSRGSSQPRNQSHISYIGKWVLYRQATSEAQATFVKLLLSHLSFLPLRAYTNLDSFCECCCCFPSFFPVPSPNRHNSVYFLTPSNSDHAVTWIKLMTESCVRKMWFWVFWCGEMVVSLLSSH